MGGRGGRAVAGWRRKLLALPSPASCLCAGSQGPCGRDGAGAGARVPAAPRCTPRRRPGKGHGAGCCRRVTHSIRCQQRCEQHLPQAPQPHGDPARSQPLRVLAKLPGRGERVPEYPHPSLQHRQPSRTH